MKQKEPERELTPEEERVLRGCTFSAGTALVFVLVVLLVFLLHSCKTVYVDRPYPVPEVHTEHHYHTDSVNHTDSVIDHQTTIIREVDSATMAQYGIQLKDMERAWLIQSDRLYKEIERLNQSKADTVIVRDTIPQLVPVPSDPVIVPAELTAWQIFRIKLANILLIAGLIAAAYGLYRIRSKWWPIVKRIIGKL